MEPNLTKISWREAATGGLWLGLALCGVTVVGYLTRMSASLSWATGLLNFLLLAGFILTYGRRMGAHYAAQGFTFIQSIGFTLKMMMFAGIIAGLGQFIMQTYVDPQYYRDIMETTLQGSGFSQEQIDMTLAVAFDQRSPVLMIFSGAMSMLIYGGLIGLVISAFIKRPADPFAGGPGPGTPPADGEPGETTSNQQPPYER